ncbi:M23 family metallopeptidase [Anaerotignum faecicola]
MKRSIAPIRKNRPSVLVWKGLAWERKKEDWLAPVTAGVVTSDCGKRENPLLHKQELHDGLDIAVPQGTEVVAVKSGTVTEVRTSATSGKLLRFETTDGYTILYAHLSEILVGQGEKIKQGQVVAKSGNTGLSTGPHLHYGIYREGKLLNPMEYLPEGAAEKV